VTKERPANKASKAQRMDSLAEFTLHTEWNRTADRMESNSRVKTAKTPLQQKALGMRAGDLGGFRHRHRNLILLEEVVRVRAFPLPASMLPTCKKHFEGFAQGTREL
jgi:hypothetical protein